MLSDSTLAESSMNFSVLYFLQFLIKFVKMRGSKIFCGNKNKIRKKKIKKIFSFKTHSHGEERNASEIHK